MAELRNGYNFYTDSAYRKSDNGSNNFLVFHVAVNGGLRSAGYSIAGVVCGSFLLLGVVMACFKILAQNNNYLMNVVGFVGSAYLVVLGINLYRASLTDEY